MPLAQYQRTTSGNEFQATPTRQATRVQTGKGKQMAANMYNAKIANFENKFKAKMDKLKAQYLEGEISATGYHSSLGALYDKMKSDAPSKALKYKYRVAVAQQMQYAEKAARSGYAYGGSGGGGGKSGNGTKDYMAYNEAIANNEQQVAVLKSDLEDGKITSQQYIEGMHGLKEQKLEIYDEAQNDPSVGDYYKGEYAKKYENIVRESNDVHGSTTYFGGIDYMYENREMAVVKSKADGRKEVTLDKSLVDQDRAYSQSDGNEYVKGGDGAYYQVGNLVTEDKTTNELKYFDNNGRMRTINVDQSESLAGQQFYNPVTGQDEVFPEDEGEIENKLNELRNIESVRITDPQDPLNAKTVVQSNGGGWVDLGNPTAKPTQQPSYTNVSEFEAYANERGMTGEEYAKLQETANQQGMEVDEYVQKEKERQKNQETQDKISEYFYKKREPMKKKEPLDIDIPEFKEEKEDPRTKQIEAPPQEHNKVGYEDPVNQRSVEMNMPQGVEPNRPIQQSQESPIQNNPLQQEDPMQKLMQGQQVSMGGFGNFKKAFKTKNYYA